MRNMLRIWVVLIFSIVNLRADIEYYPHALELATYLSEMPWNNYKMYQVPNLGKFWVDDAKDGVKDTIKRGEIWEKYILRIFGRYIKPGDKVVDIGGHMGTITLALSNLVGESGKVYSFEGERQFFRELVENIKLNQKENVIPYLAWITNEDKEVKIECFYGSDYSPVHRAQDKPYLLNVRKLDSFGFKDISLLKIDVECMEDKVLDGAYNTIMSSRPVIVIEIMGGYGDKITPEIQKRIDHTVEKLNAMNYHVSKIWIDDYLALPVEKEYSYYPQEEWLSTYIGNMPWQHYKRYEVAELGKFWVEEARDCVKDTIKQGKIWEPYILEVLQKYIKKGDQVIDIGAHMGTITFAMSNLVGENGKVHSFEGERQLFRELVENVKLNRKRNITPYLAWIGKENKKTTASWSLTIPNYVYSTVYSPEGETYPLSMRSLDSFNFENVSLIKIDVECTENDVIEGAYNTIMSSRPVIVIEIMGGYGDKITPEIQKKIDHTISKLTALNYDVSKIWIDDYLAIPNEKKPCSLPLSKRKQIFRKR